ncbi:hypothetical protein FISHEDRAFT_56202 [Fistulina hepatica ATCC 64428]|uniref:Redoxin domain-containing protein n=1 Tax=Fistulina hepatica ATCC 64428 TaxID=1128425 RepID=A0A0D7AKX6_9AGAR|nr:hypothetical protein FISHEDRAFT_56202 [Fistulina hepatica ATCC 64428]
MTSLIGSTAQAAHSAFVAVLSTAEVKEGAADTPIKLNFDEGRRVIVGVPGAFTARKEKLAPAGTRMGSIALTGGPDDQGLFVSSLGLVFDATSLRSGPRSKRFVIVADGPKVTTITVEKDPGQLTSTDAHAVLSLL